MLLVECVYAPQRETNSPLTFIPSLQHEAQMCRVLCYRRLHRNGLLVAVALGHRPTAIMVRCIPAVSVTFKCRWVLLLSLMCAVETEDDCFRYTCVRSIGAGIEAFFSIPIPNRCWRYRPIPSTRCQYRSHPNSYTAHVHRCSKCANACYNPRSGVVYVFIGRNMTASKSLDRMSDCNMINFKNLDVECSYVLNHSIC